MSNLIIHPTRANITLFQRDLLRAGDDERWKDAIFRFKAGGELPVQKRCGPQDKNIDYSVICLMTGIPSDSARQGMNQNSRSCPYF